MAFPSVSSSKPCPRDLDPRTVRPPPSTRENRFARPSPFGFARAVTGVVCNPTIGREKRFRRRTVSSTRGGEDVEGGIDAGTMGAGDGGPKSFERKILGCKDEGEASMDSSVCAEKCEVLGLGVTCKASSWKFSRMWRNEGGRDAGLRRITGLPESPCSSPSSTGRLGRTLSSVVSLMRVRVRLGLLLSIAMSSEGVCVNARAGVDCQEGKFDKVKVGVEEGMLGEAEGVIIGNTVS